MAQIPSHYRALEKSHRLPRAGARVTGPADAKEVFTVSVRVRRRHDAPALPDLSDLAATPRGERQYLSREDFAAHFGAAQEDLDKVSAFAHEHGLEVVEASIPRRIVGLRGTTEQFSKAFAVDLNIYQTPEETYRGREGAIHVPEDLADIIEGVFGLDNRRMARPLHKRTNIKAADVAPTQATVPLTPPHVAQLYGFPVSPNASGQTIALLEFGGGYKLSDVQLFCNSVQAP